MFLLDTLILLVSRIFVNNSFLADQILFCSILTAAVFVAFLLVLQRNFHVIERQNPTRDSIFQFLREPSIIFLFVIAFFSSTVLVQTQTLLNIDRSRSFFILEWVNCAPSNQLYVIESKIESFYGKGELAAFNLRLAEHQARGLIVNKGNTIELTPLGVLLFRFSDLTATSFNLSGWKLNKIWSGGNC